MMLVLVLGSTTTFTSCGDDDKDDSVVNPSTPIVDGINPALIPGEYEFNGNIAPSFTLFKDGTCDISTTSTKAKWTYEKTTHTLLVGSHVYIIKLLTEESLVAEWTSVKYGTSVSSWNRKPLPEDVKHIENGHEYVDLGLSVKWATMNIGAKKPEDYGSYFAWGEITPKSTYNWTNYQWCNGTQSSITKYRVNTSQVSLDGRKFLENEDDAACVIWGGEWRTPTNAQLNELKLYCTWNWTSRNEVNGCLITSKKNGNSIFLPAAGCYKSSGSYNVGSKGYYWSSQLDKELEQNAMYWFFSSTSTQYSDEARYIGMPVRAVCP